jgi:hypothetical protein
MALTILIAIGCFTAGFFICALLSAGSDADDLNDAWLNGYKQAIRDKEL